MAIYILRHGQEEEGKFYNPELRHQDPPLSEKEKNDAIELIQYFSNKGSRKSILVRTYVRSKLLNR